MDRGRREKGEKDRKTRKVTRRQTHRGVQSPGPDARGGGRRGSSSCPNGSSDADPATGRLCPALCSRGSPPPSRGACGGLPRLRLEETWGSFLKSKRFAYVFSLISLLPPLHADTPPQSTLCPAGRAVFKQHQLDPWLTLTLKPCNAHSTSFLYLWSPSCAHHTPAMLAFFLFSPQDLCTCNSVLGCFTFPPQGGLPVILSQMHSPPTTLCTS